MQTFEFLHASAAAVRRQARPRALLAAMAALLASSLAHAAPSAGIPKPLDVAIKEKAAELAAACRAAGALDVTPPELTRLRVRGDIDATLAGQFIEIDVGITDDRSGLYGYFLSLRAPSGKTVNYSPATLLPSRSYRDTVNIGNLVQYGYVMAPSAPLITNFSEPGVWVIDGMYLFDLAGNGRTYTAADLAPFGNLKFNVSNPAGFDTTPPSLHSGVIGTRSVRLSKTPPGTATGTLPFAYADLTILDTGNGVVSGATSAVMSFCQPSPQGWCNFLTLYGQIAKVGVGKGVLRVSNQLWAGQPAGKYQLHSLSLTDVAGNATYMTALQFGGSTDFSAYFPSTTITLKP